MRPITKQTYQVSRSSKYFIYTYIQRARGLWRAILGPKHKPDSRYRSLEVGVMLKPLTRRERYVLGSSSMILSATLRGTGYSAITEVGLKNHTIRGFSFPVHNGTRFGPSEPQWYIDIGWGRMKASASE